MNPYTETTASLVGTARALVEAGVPYVYGGASPAEGFDCSGLTAWVFGASGIDLPRTTGEQWEVSQEIPAEQAQPGDLIFYWNGDDPEPFHVQIVSETGTTTVIEAASEQNGLREIARYPLGDRSAVCRPLALTVLSMQQDEA